MSILKELQTKLPKDAEISEVKFEGSEIVIYTKNSKFFRESEEIVKSIVREIKKRMEVRPDLSIVQDQEKTKEIIEQVVPKDAGIQAIYFEPELGKVVIEAQKPGLVIGKGGETYRRIKDETLWLPKIERAPAIESKIVRAVRSLLHTEIPYRKTFLNRVGQLINTPEIPEEERKKEWIRLTALGGYRQVGRSCTLVQTPYSNIMLDCGVDVGSAGEDAHPLLDVPEFNLDKLDAVVVSHSHLDHCLHPDTYIQLPEGDVVRITDYYELPDSEIVSANFDGNLEIERVRDVKKVRIKSPKYLYKISTKTRSVRVTPEHPFFVFEEGKFIVKTAGQLQDGEFIATAKEIPFTGKSQPLPNIIRLVRISKAGQRVLRNARESLDLKQADIAIVARCSQATVSAIERGEKACSPELLRRVLQPYKLAKKFHQKYVKRHFNRSTKILLPKTSSPEFCQLLGYLLGDGHKADVRMKGKRIASVSVTDKDVANLTIYKTLIEKNFGLKGNIKCRERNRLIVSSSIFLDFIQTIEKDILCRSPFRRIPRLIHRVSKKELAAFLRGLYDAEGSVGDHAIILTSTSHDIVQAAQMLLLRFGILSHIYDSNNPKSTRQVYALTIYSPEHIKKFRQTIGFGSKRKKIALEELSKKIGHACAQRMDLFPLSGQSILNFAKALGLRKCDLRKMGINYYHYLTGHKPTKKKAIEIINKFKQVAKKRNIILDELRYLERVAKSQILLEPVKKMKIRSDCKFVYDLKVPGHHNYIANGIVVHNCGYVPWLYDQGYKGPLYCTAPTRDLMVLLCLDYIDVCQREGKNIFYTKKSVEKAVKHSITLNYGEVSDISTDTRLTLQPSAHLLGSSLVHLHVGEGLHNILYTSDYKFGPSRLFDPAFTGFKRAETVITESTYGASKDILPNRQEAERMMLDVINRTMERGGKVLIPSFAVGRGQEVMVILANSGIKHPVYIEGMIWDATAIHTAYPEYLSRYLQKSIFHYGKNPFVADCFRRIVPKERKEVLDSAEPGVVIATSGMLIGGPAVEYLKAFASDPRNTLLFVGYQGEGTLGRRIQKGWKEIPLPSVGGRRQVLEIKMQVETAHGLTGHSGRNQLLGFVRRLGGRPERIIINHGEQKKCLELGRDMHRSFRVETVSPKNLESVRVR